MRVQEITLVGTRAEMSELRDELENQCIQTVEYDCVAGTAPDYTPATHIALRISAFNGADLSPELLQHLMPELG